MINVLLAIMVIGSFLLALALHEFGHALMALWLGDRTPRNEGRLSLNLRSHVDPLGLLMCIFLAFQPGLVVGLGWGKPVKPDPWKLRPGPNAGVMMVAWAGPIFNLLIGLLCAVALRFIFPLLYTSGMVNNPFAQRLVQLLVVFASVNIGLTILNLLPFYPLDGYQIVYTLLPSRQALQFAKSATYGPFIILIIFFLLPFLGQISGLGSLPIFHLPDYILLGAQSLLALVLGDFSKGYTYILTFYFL